MARDVEEGAHGCGRASSQEAGESAWGPGKVVKTKNIIIGWSGCACSMTTFM